MRRIRQGAFDQSLMPYGSGDRAGLSHEQRDPINRKKGGVNVGGKEEKTGNQGILAPQMVCSYRCAFSAPLVQKFLYFRPAALVTGQVGHMHPFSAEIHMKLLPVAQKSNSSFFLAQELWVGQVGQIQTFLFSAIHCACWSAVIPFIFFIRSSKASMGTPQRCRRNR